ncbi:MAG: STAS domain-containing protein [Polyangiaceae bacterium]|jgi:rsbT antagonist protein RsbS|nr:STAS domain-containing protein [Polyangiaceae bacterium]
MSEAFTPDDAVNRIPIIKLWHLLLVPIQGHITDRQLDQLSEGLLNRIHETGATGIVIDVTGMWLIDSHTCALLSRIATSARLMGARTVLCGMSPEIALTLQSMGLDLPEVKTELTLEEALLGLGIESKSASQEDDESWLLPSR